MRSRLLSSFALVAITVVAASVWPATERTPFATTCRDSTPSVPESDEDSDNDGDRQSDSDPDHEEREAERDGLDEIERAMPAAAHASFGAQFRHGTSRLSSSARRRFATLRPTSGFEREEDRPPEA